MRRSNFHATAVVAGGTGLLITGRSGAGKSSLAWHLIELYRAHGIFAALVADDRVWLDLRRGRLIAEVPEAIAGLIEIRGFGPAPLPHEPRAVMDRVVMLVDPVVAPRHRGEEKEILLGCALPRLDLPEGNAIGSASAVAAWLADWPAGDAMP